MELMEEKVDKEKIEWKNILHEGLDLMYASQCLSTKIADSLFKILESELEYFAGEFAKVKVYGKWHPIPRKQVAFGDEGLSYKFSGNKIPALKWHPQLVSLKNILSLITGFNFNFVLVNRYQHGDDHMGEHRDDESELESNAPIASISLGQTRDMIFKHADSRRCGPQKRNIPPVKLSLQHGSLLLMNPPTNRFWYHSIPKRKNCPGVRINLTFRKMVLMEGKHV